jgi:hypothetical protein
MGTSGRRKVSNARDGLPLMVPTQQHVYSPHGGWILHPAAMALPYTPAVAVTAPLLAQGP